jgi:tRNA threonylcarbamoyladenosine biosynthesis protein TsaB
MALLAIDTSTSLCSIALKTNRGIQCIESVLTNHTHSDKIFEFTEQLLEENSLKFSDLKGIVTGLGPGSYTGLRVSASAVKGWAFGLDIPVYGVSSLELIYKAIESKNFLTEDELVIVAIDARRMEVYASAFEKCMNPVFTNLAVKVSAETWKDLSIKYKKIIVAGVGVSKLRNVLMWPNLQLVDGVYPSAKYAFDLIADPLHLACFEPIYVKQFGEL